LLQARLVAVLPLRPARAFLQAQRGLGEKSADGGLTRAYIDSFAGFGASDAALAAASKVGS
jgi:hypothetical protein